jgi:uncharacterized protein (TIGR03437 family)
VSVQVYDVSRKTMTKNFRALLIACAFAGILPAQPVVSAVLNGASYSAAVSPGCWVVIFGTRLAAAPMSAPSGALPNTLAGVSVSVAGLPAPLLYVSPNQINALIPFETLIPGNTVAPVVVNAPGGTSTYNIRLSRNAPAIFTRNGAGTGRALVFDANFQAVDTVGVQDTVILYATGLGPVSGTQGQVVDGVEVYIGERKAQVLFAGLAPGFPGIFQLNVISPVPATDRLYLRTGGWQSNVVDIGIRAGANTANVKGTIDGLYPSNDPAFPNKPQPPCVSEDQPGPCGGGAGFSLVLHAGSFTVSFDIVPSASPFAIAAVGEAGGTIISIDPATSTYTASVATIITAAKFGDFSSTGMTLWDYLSCMGASAVCFPFPANIMPLSRIDPFWARATQRLPAPNTPTAGIANAVFQVSGSLGGPRFAVDDQNNSALSPFGGVVPVQYGPFDVRVSTFKLYVDGRLIASKDLPYAVIHR